VSGVDQALSRALQDDTVRNRMNDAGIDPDHIGKAASSSASAATPPAAVRSSARPASGPSKEHETLLIVF